MPQASDGKASVSQARSERGKGISLPGQPTEKAAAEVATEAGKSLVRGLGRLGNAMVDGWASTKEARAAAAKLAIETEASVAREIALMDARRQAELDEVDHQALLQRRALRLRAELEREQINLESIQAKAIEFTEADIDSDKPREIDDDWIFMFSDFAQRVSDAEIQSLWARALSCASIEGAAKLSAASLQTLSLFNRDIAKGFQGFVTAIKSLKSYPALPKSDPQNINLEVLQDLGLIRERPLVNRFSLADFRVGHYGETLAFGGDLYGLWALTVRGEEVANAIFREHVFELSADLELLYLTRFVEAQFPTRRTLDIQYSQGERNVGLCIHTMARSDWRALSVGIPPRLMRLLDWVDSRYSIQMLSGE
jgi:hypothetical protein